MLAPTRQVSCSSRAARLREERSHAYRLQWLLSDLHSFSAATAVPFTPDLMFLRNSLVDSMAT